LKNRSESTLFNSLKKKILIVDDEPYNLLGLKIMLQQTIKSQFQNLDLQAEGDTGPDGYIYTRDTSDIHKATNG
jgi:hypothetical protein